MKGKNPLRKPVFGDGESLDIQEIFATLQGEGPYAGMKAVFIRLGGCNLACSFCDTEFESFAPMDLQQILGEVQALAGQGTKLVVITGGEPLRQPIELLCTRLIAQGFTVQIETNGTLWRELPAPVQIVCSPKHAGPGYGAIRPDVLSRIAALKFLISQSDTAYSQVPALPAVANLPPVYLQPIDEGDTARNAQNLALCLALAHQHGYHISLQTHKTLGIR